MTRESLSSVTVVSIERATLDERPPRLSLRDRLAAWFVTGPLGRLLAFLLDLATLFSWGIATAPGAPHAAALDLARRVAEDRPVGQPLHRRAVVGVDLAAGEPRPDPV